MVNQGPIRLILKRPHHGMKHFCSNSAAMHGVAPFLCYCDLQIYLYNQHNDMCNRPTCHGRTDNLLAKSIKTELQEEEMNMTPRIKQEAKGNRMYRLWKLRAFYVQRTSNSWGLHSSMFSSTVYCTQRRGVQLYAYSASLADQRFVDWRQAT